MLLSDVACYVDLFHVWLWFIIYLDFFKSVLVETCSNPSNVYLSFSILAYLFVQVAGKHLFRCWPIWCMLHTRQFNLQNVIISSFLTIFSLTIMVLLPLVIFLIIWLFLGRWVFVIFVTSVSLPLILVPVHDPHCIALISRLYNYVFIVSQLIQGSSLFPAEFGSHLAELKAVVSFMRTGTSGGSSQRWGPVRFRGEGWGSVSFLFRKCITNLILL